MKIGIDLGGTNVRMGVVDSGAIVRKIAEPCKSQASQGVVIEHLISMIHSIMDEKIDGIGIGVPSVVDTEKGIVYDVANIPSWKEVPLKEILERKFGIPVMINNDCNCFAYGEYLFGGGVGYKNIVGVTLGTGVGMGLIIDGNLYNGNNTGAGEIGCIAYLDHDYEYYCGSRFFQLHNTTGEELYKKAMLGDSGALDLWAEMGEHIGNLINTTLFAYDPEAIILGGSISSAFEFFSKAMCLQLESFPYSNTVKRIKIAVSSKSDIGILGAAMLK